MKISTNIELNDIEQDFCKILAKARFENNRDSSIKNSKIGPQSNADTDLEGIAAEIAFCKLFNIYPDFSIFIRSSTKDTDKYDVVLANGKTVDIKTTKYKTGKLLAVSWKKASSDYTVLMVGQFPNYEFKGAIETKELLKKERLGNLGYGETYIATQNELKELVCK
mgnify:FL=1